MKPLRPSRWQETIRQWILLIPLVTAIVGTMGIRVGPEEEWVDYLPPLFFVGALVVTASMLHQRRMAMTNLELAEQVHRANERLDTLHRLGLELNKRLELLPVAQTLLEDSRQSMDVDAAALWMRREGLPAPLLGASFWKSLPLAKISTGDEITTVEPGPWCCIAASGFVQPEQHRCLAQWDNALDGGQWRGEALSFRVSSHRSSRESSEEDLGSRLASLRLAHARKAPKEDVGVAALASVFSAPAAAATVPIVWEDEVVGAILLANWNRPLAKDDVVLLRDIALVVAPALQNALLFGAATARAEIDALTGLYNHRVLQERLTQELARASRALDVNPCTRLSLAILDVTDFKLFNDTYGHGTGDKVLGFIAECLRASFRASDVIARYGGDEFVVILPDTDSPYAERTCRRAIELVASRPFEAPDGSRVAVRVACGLAIFPYDGRTIAELISSADERLYAAKKRGLLMLDKSTGPVGSEDSLGEEEEAGDLGEPIPDPSAEGLWNDLSVYEALVAAIDSKDKYTRRHTESVCRHALLLARELGLPEAMIEAVRVASLVHDVGKIVVPDAILRKPGRLTEDETRVMRRHVIFGEQLVLHVPQREEVLAGVRHHHERWDGQGYPDNLRGEEIPLMGRLLAVPDSFVAMTIDRPYRRALSIEEALREIEKESSIQFDPQIVEAFARALRR
jgi:diguanylate cyclase (GGDEF)-like protein